MNIVIAGGGDIGYNIATKLIKEDHKITLIDNSIQRSNELRENLDAKVISGKAEDLRVLKEANIEAANLFIAVTNDDNINIISCILANKLNNELITISKVGHSYYYFDDKIITPKELNISLLIDPKKLTVDKIKKLIDRPQAIEVVNYENDNIELIGLEIENDFKFLNFTIQDLVREDDIFKNINIVAIDKEKSDKTIIPRGNTPIEKGDKIFLIGRTSTINKIIEEYFSTRIKLNRVIIIGGNKLGELLAKSLLENRKEITIIEEDPILCGEIAKELKNILVLNGSANNETLLNEINFRDSCVVCLTNDDEYNVISAINAKKNGAAKTICIVKNTSLLPIIDNLQSIDSYISPTNLVIGEIIKFCRKGNITSISTFTEINAETISLSINSNIPILGKKLKEIKLPNDILIGAIIRGKEIIIPDGETILELNDKLIIFILPTAIKELEDLFFTNIRRNK